MNKDFRGTGVAMVTPFKNDKTVDFEALKKLTNHLIDGGVDYLVVQGTTGESATLSPDEKRKVLDTILEVNNSALPIVYGHGGNNTKALIDAFQTMDLNGVDAILSVSPYYNKPTQRGIIEHFTAIADTSPVPVILYNVPGRTSSNMLAETTLTLANHDQIIAVKEASGDLDQVGAIIIDRPSRFLVLSGDDPLIVPHMSLGGDGIISVIGNAFPKEFSQIAQLCFQGDYNKARQLHYMLINLTHMLFKEGNPAGVKCALNARGIGTSVVRLPLVEASAALREQIQFEVSKIEKAAIA